MWTDGKKIYRSSIFGRVYKISIASKEIYIQDVDAPDNIPIEQDIKDLQALYKERSDTELFIKDWWIKSLYPVLLASAPILDPSVASIKDWAIVYRTGGGNARWEAANKSAKVLTDSYNKNVQEESGEKKVKKAAENDQLLQIKEKLDNLKTSYYKSLDKTGKDAIYQAQRTVVDKKELSLVTYYYKLYSELIKAQNDSQDLEYKINTAPEDNMAENQILLSYTKNINGFLTERYFIDKSNSDAQIKELEANCLKLDKLESLPQGTKEYYPYMRGMLETQQKDGKTPEKTQNLISGFVSQLGKGNSSLSTDTKNELKYTIYSNWVFLQTISLLTVKKYETKVTPEVATKTEGSFILSFFNELYKKLNEYPIKLSEIETRLGEQSGSYLPQLGTIIDGVEYLLFSVGDASDCPVPANPIPEDISPFTAVDWDDKKYWFKYCGFATLASVISGPTNWGLGIPPPLNIPLPTVYIPLVPIRLPWGILLIGLTITGLWFFPFLLIVNQDLSYHVPLVDPATIIKKNADVIKKELIGTLRNYRTVTLKKVYADKKKDLDFYTNEVDSLSEVKAGLKLEKPKRDRVGEASDDIKVRAEAIATYAQELADWTTRVLVNQELLLTAKRDKYVAGVKVDIVARAMRGEKVPSNPDPAIIALESTEAGINKSFAAIDTLLNSIDPFLAPLPIATKPDTSNFAFTLKNPKPVQNIGAGNPAINEELIKNLLKPFDINRSDLMSSGFKAKLTSSYLNGKLVAKTISAAMPMIVTLDPYPPYEKLKVTNVAWSIGYLPKWAMTGGRSFGFPGFPAYPI